MHGRETKTKSAAPKAVEYAAADWDDYVESFSSGDASAGEAILFVPAMLQHFQRCRHSITKANDVFEAAMCFFENEPDDLTTEQLSQLVQLSALCLLEAYGDDGKNKPEDEEEYPATTFDAWVGAVLKWLSRDQQARESGPTEQLCSAIALVECIFRPIVLVTAPTVSCFKALNRVIEATKDATRRGQFIVLAAQVARDPDDPCSPQAARVEGGAFPKAGDGETEMQIAGRHIKTALHSGSQDLVIAGVRAAAIFFDRGLDGLEPSVLGIREEDAEDDSAAAGVSVAWELPLTTGQRECGVSRVEIAKSCSDEFAFMSSNQKKSPAVKIIDYIDMTLDTFPGVMYARQLNLIYSAGVEAPFQRGPALHFAELAFGYDGKRDRVGKMSKYAEQYLRSQEKRRTDRARHKDRDMRHKMERHDSMQ